MDNRLIGVIRSLYDEATSAVVLGGNVEDISFGRQWEGVGQGCPLSLVLFIIFLENIKQKTLFKFVTSVYVGGQPLYNLWFADVIGLLGDSENSNNSSKD